MKPVSAGVQSLIESAALLVFNGIFRGLSEFMAYTGQILQVLLVERLRCRIGTRESAGTCTGQAGLIGFLQVSIRGSGLAGKQESQFAFSANRE